MTTSVQIETPPAARLLSLRSGLLLLAVLGLMVGAWLVYDGAARKPQPQPALDFTLPLLGEEGEFTLADQRGKVVVVNIWASWCIPCQEEAPVLQSLYEDFQAQDVVFVGVAVDDTEANALAYIEQYHLTYPNVFDANWLIEQVYHVYGIPVTWIVGKDGKMQQWFFSKPDPEEFRQAIQDALKSFQGKGG
jgi:cytochrome c biogenesis protein CcmG/thiol:disulfide interchange protein DsbE